jgi:hypothetical protein
MTIDKDPSIIDLLERLRLDERGWFMRDYWEADLCAVGISSRKQPSRLVYVSTFNKLANEYDYELEQLSTSTTGDYDCVSDEQSVGFEDLVCRMEAFLN